MAYDVVIVNNHPVHSNLKQFICTTADDISSLPTSTTRGTQETTDDSINEPVAIGSAAYLADGSAIYNLSADNTWIPQTVVSGGGGTSIPYKLVKDETPTEGSIATYRLVQVDGDSNIDVEGSEVIDIPETNAYTKEESDVLLNAKLDTKNNAGEDVSGLVIDKYVPFGNSATCGSGAERFNSKQNMYGNMAIGQYSHAEGRQTASIGDYSHAEGYCGNAYGKYSHVEGYGLNRTNGTNSLKITSTTTNDEIIADHKNATYSLAKGEASHVEGYCNLALGNHSHAEGSRTVVVGTASHAEGENTTASGNASHAEGYNTTASGQYSHAEGYITKASGMYSHAEGMTAQATEFGSHAEGSGRAKGGYSHAEGGSTAEGNSSHAEGISTTATGTASHSEGYETIAFSENSHAEGYRTMAYGQYSHIEGEATYKGTSITSDTTNEEIMTKWNSNRFSLAKGKASHVEGKNNLALGNYSHVEGERTVAVSDYQHIQGKYNIADSENKYSFIIGNGESDTTRSNAFAIDWDGKIYINNATEGIDLVDLVNRITALEAAAATTE